MLYSKNLRTENTQKCMLNFSRLHRKNLRTEKHTKLYAELLQVIH